MAPVAFFKYDSLNISPDKATYPGSQTAFVCAVNK